MDLPRIRRSAGASRSVHELTDSAEDADVILFVDNTSIDQGLVRRHPLARKYPGKAFVYSTNDHELPLLPGVYAGAARAWNLPSHVKAGFYVKVIDHGWITPSEMESARYLYSFCGSFDTHPFRERLAALTHPRGFVRDTSKDQARRYGETAGTYQAWQNEYAEVIKESKFICCPRGAAPSSFRIFEAMKAGRVPVVISDRWIAPVGPRWEEFSVRIAEGQVAQMPSILETMEDRAPDMGRLARKAWEEWFSLEKAFQTIAGWCFDIQKSRAGQGAFDKCLPTLQRARPIFVRKLILSPIKARILSLKATK